jgi:hypothetical protein
MTKTKFDFKLVGSGPKGTWLGITLSDAVKARLGVKKARLPIAGTADGHPFRTSAAPMGGEHCFVFTRELQAATGKRAGDSVKFEIWADDAPRTVEVPADLAAALKKSKAKAGFDSLSYTHQKEYVKWVEEAKRPETRARRVAETVTRSAAGKGFGRD